MTQKNYWMHRISYDWDLKKKFLDENGLLLTAWASVSTEEFLNNVYGTDKQTFDEVYKKLVGELPRNRFFLYMFLNEFKKGDYVLVPGVRDFSVYEIISDKPLPKDQLIDKVKNSATQDTLELSNGFFHRKDTKQEVDLGFFWEVKVVEQNISRELYAMDNLRKRMKFQGTDNNLTALGDEVEEAIRRHRSEQALDFRKEVTKDVSNLVLQKLQNVSSDASFEKIVERYLKKIGATRTCIPAKTLLGNEKGDADVVADFDELQVRIIVQVKHYLKAVDENAVKQIVAAKKFYDDSSYTVIPWVVAACDTFTDEAQKYAEKNGVRLIGGSEFASSLLEIGLG